MDALTVFLIILSIGVATSTVAIILVVYFAIRTLKLIQETLLDVRQASGEIKDSVKLDGAGYIFSTLYKIAKSKYRKWNK
ncbi:hypothetical protein IPM62_03810 [Candidatus Woesebacteria bacterium]|nr:MAG: hypothetical protein IPM62_03810 [Candidatus Woesebacteria bacterium]